MLPNQNENISPQDNEQAPSVTLWGPPVEPQPANTTELVPATPTTPTPEDAATLRKRIRTGVIAGILLAIFLPAIPIVFALFASISADPTVIDNQESLTRLTETLMSSGAIIFVSILCTWFGLLAGVRLASRQYPGGWKTLVSWKFDWKRDILIAASFTIVARGIEFGVSKLLESFNIKTEELSNANFIQDLSGGWLAAVLLAAAIGAPIVEEIFFRGMFLQYFFPPARAHAMVVPGIITTSIIFGFMHLQGTLGASVYTVATTAIIGAALAIIVVKTRRLGSTILSHMLFNTSGVILALLVLQ